MGSGDKPFWVENRVFKNLTWYIDISRTWRPILFKFEISCYLKTPLQTGVFLLKCFFLCELKLQKSRVSIFGGTIKFDHKFARKTNLKKDIKNLRHRFWENYCRYISANFWGNRTKEFFSTDVLLKNKDFDPKCPSHVTIMIIK